MIDHRLFTGLDSNSINAKENEALIEAMKSKSNEGDGNFSKILAGFTYLGQMIAHDIVKSTNDSDSRKVEVNPSLMLDSIYGDEKFRKKYQIIDDEGRFKLNSIEYLVEEEKCKGKEKKTKNEYKDIDLYRKGRKTLIPDIRNDENFLVSQLHVFWQNLHNIVIDNKYFINFCESKPDDMSAEEKFQLARELVIKTFQQVVIEDYLYNILDLDIYKSYIKKANDQNGLFFYKEGETINEVPLEFSHAAFRFGHSMVRESYVMNDVNSEIFSLDKLFNIKHKSITFDKIVDWRKFFGNSKKDNLVFARKINDFIVNPMKQIPGQGNPIIKLNLDAGFKKKLPSGYQVLEHIRNNHSKVANELKLCVDNYPKINYENSRYQEIVEIEKVPIWLYVLIEAKSQTKNGKDHRLGKLGSTLVAEVVFQSIKQAEISILKQGSLYESNHGDMFSRLSKKLFQCANNSDELYVGLLNDFRRFKMIDLINEITKLK